MLEDQVLKMEPGRELNILVAKQVMGHEVIADEIMGDTERLIDEGGESVWGSLFPYSEDMTAAQAVVDQMLGNGYTDATTWKDYGDGCYAPAEAICKRALLALSQ